MVQLPLNTFYLPKLTSEGYPILPKCDVVPEWLWPYRLRSRRPSKPGGCLHFFIDDHRFERLWRFPLKTLPQVASFGLSIAPDFSLYLDWPTPLKKWNIYRSRWLAAYWVSKGIKVIPCVSWAEPSSYEYCFSGIPLHSTLAISTMGIRKDSESESIFFHGAHTMSFQLRPSTVVVYGEKFQPELQAIFPKVVFYPHYRKYLNGRQR